MNSKEYEIAQALVNLNDSQQIHETLSSMHQRRKNSTDAIIDKNIYLFSEFQKYTHASSSPTHSQDCLVQLAPIRDTNTHDQGTLSPIVYVKEENNDDDEKRRAMSNEKPRWSHPMRSALLEAVIEQKELSDMATFNWAAIGRQVGRSGKACKDQWRRAILPKLQQMYQDDTDE